MTLSNENSFPPYNLARLHEYVGSEPDVVRNMVSIFIEAISESIVKMHSFKREGNIQALAREAHKVKASLQIFGFDDQIDTILLLEKSTNTLPEGIDIKIDLLHQRLQQGIQALKNDFDL